MRKGGGGKNQKICTHGEHVCIGRLFFLDAGLVIQTVRKHRLVVVLHHQSGFLSGPSALDLRNENGNVIDFDDRERRSGGTVVVISTTA